MRPSQPTRRPETARSRDDREGRLETPSAEELDVMERHLAALPVHSGGRADMDRETGVLLIRADPPGRGLDYAAAVRWSGDEWAARLAAMQRRARQEGRWPSLLVADGLTRPTDLAVRLADAGWTKLVGETTLWARRPATVPHLDPSLRLEAVTERTAADHEDLERGIFGLPAWSSTARLEGLTAGVRDGSLRAFLIRSSGAPVAVARLSLRGGSAGLYGIGVRPGRRRQGLGGLVTAIAMRAALARGGRLVWLSVEDGNTAARTLYERFGFQPGFGWSRWMAPSR